MFQLEENGSFSSKCKHSGFHFKTNGTSIDANKQIDEICPEQTAALVNIHVIATFSKITSPILGHLMDTLGAKQMAFLMISLLWIGLGLLLVAVAGPFDYVLYIAYLFLAIGTWIGAMLTLQTGLYFNDEKTRNRVIIILNSLFDAGSTTYLGVWAIGEAFNVGTSTLLGGFLVLSIIVFVPSGYTWYHAVPANPNPNPHGGGSENPLEKEDLTSTTELIEENDIGEGALVLDDCDENGRQQNTAKNELSQYDDIEVAINSCQPSETTDKSTHPNFQHLETASMSRDSDSEGESIPDLKRYIIDEEARSDYVLIADRSPWQQLTSRPMVLVGIFFAIHMAGTDFTLTTTRDYLAYLGDDELGNRYLSVFIALSPASLLAVPFLDFVLNRIGLYGAFQIINALSMLYLAIRVFHDQLDGLQELGFWVFSFYRCFLFGVTFSFLPTLLCPNVVGRATGYFYTASALLALVLNIALSNISILRFDGDFRLANAVYTALMLPCIVGMWFVGQCLRQEQAAKGSKIKRVPSSRHSIGFYLP